MMLISLVFCFASVQGNSCTYLLIGPNIFEQLFKEFLGNFTFYGRV